MLFTFRRGLVATNGFFAWATIVDDQAPAPGLEDEAAAGDGGSRLRRPRDKSYA